MLLLQSERHPSKLGSTKSWHWQLGADALLNGPSEPCSQLHAYRARLVEECNRSATVDSVVFIEGEETALPFDASLSKDRMRNSWMIWRCSGRPSVDSAGNGVQPGQWPEGVGSR